jgi:hypothetical protein
MYNLNDQWDRYMLRYSGYAPDTLWDFVERGLASYDEATDTFTVFAGEQDGHTWEEFTVGLWPEFAVTLGGEGGTVTRPGV